MSVVMPLIGKMMVARLYPTDSLNRTVADYGRPPEA